MKGRTENEIKIEKKIQQLLINCPDIIKQYSYSFTNKTAMTKNAYLRHIINFVNYLQKTKEIDEIIWKDIKPSDINQYMEQIRWRYVNDVKVENKASIRANKLFAIKNFFDFLITEDLIEKNPCDRVSAPKDNEEKDIVFLTQKEIEIVKNNIENGVGSLKAKARQKTYKNRDLLIVLLGCRTGLRVTSLTEINIEDIDFENQYITVTEKGNKTRNIQVAKNTILLIKNWIMDRKKILGDNVCDALFISERKERITPAGIAKILKKYTYNINKNITPHKMRSSCACNLLDATDNIYLVQEILGHKNIGNTRRYARVSAKSKQQAANLMDKMF